MMSKRRVTTEIFIERARDVHSCKYDYSNTNYVDNRTKLEVICPKHGSFFILPSNHTSRKVGCKICSVERRVNSKDYNYYFEKYKDKLRPDFEYLDFYNKRYELYVVFRCEEHGVKTQRFNNHINQEHGCNECAKKHVADSQRHTHNNIVEKFREKHGLKFDYSRVNYINYNTKVEISCPEHGLFEQTPSDHIGSKYGCFECATGYKRVNGTNYKYSTESFKEGARELHGDSYNYAKSIFTGMDKHITITCSVHGDFITTPLVHLKGHKCRKCASLVAGEHRRKWNTSDFIEKSRELFGDIFTYELTKSKQRTDRVVITCKKHGDFTQTVSGHLVGKMGCKQCVDSINSMLYFERHDISNLYLLKITLDGYEFLKVGISVNTVHRASEIKSALGSTCEVEILYSMESVARRVWLAEKTIHESPLLEKYDPLTNFGGMTECYTMENLEILIEWFNNFGGLLNDYK